MKVTAIQPILFSCLIGTSLQTKESSNKQDIGCGNANTIKSTEEIILNAKKSVESLKDFIKKINKTISIYDFAMSFESSNDTFSKNYAKSEEYVIQFCPEMTHFSTHYYLYN